MLLKHEGGFVDHPKDLGGVTNLGVTKRVMQEFLDRDVSMGEMKALTAEDGQRVYKKLYADKVHFDELVAGLDWALLDWAASSGLGRGAKALQEILVAKQDDAIGPKTLQPMANFDADAVAALTEFFDGHIEFMKAKRETEGPRKLLHYCISSGLEWEEYGIA